MTSNTTRPMSVKLDPDTRTRLENLAAVRRRSTHWIMRDAIQQYVEREEKRETFRQDTLKAWEEFQATDLYTAAEEVDAWLASWVLMVNCKHPNATSKMCA